MPLRYPPAHSEQHAYPLHIGQLFRSALDTHSDQVIVGSDGQRFDYPSFGRRVHQLAHALTALGVGPGDVVSAMDWDSHRYLECYFAVPMLGAVLHTVNVRLSPDQIAYTLDSTNPRVLLFHSDFEALVAQIAPRLSPIVRLVFVRDQPSCTSPLNPVGEYEELIARYTDDYPFQDVDELAQATTFHTTGTTGQPKAVGFSHRQLVLHTLAVMGTLGTQPDHQGLRRGDVYMPITPMFHVHAWGIPFIATVLGLKQVYPGRYEATRLLKLRREEKVSFSHCVPTVLTMLLDAFSSEDPLQQPWTILVGGSALSRDLHRRAAACGITAVTGYGMSETAPVLSIAYSLAETADAREQSLCSAGHPVPLAQLRIVDEAMTTLPTDGEAWGELVARAPWLTSAYRGDAEASGQLWKGGWLHTQDIASITSDGCVEIRDRLKDVIKTGGEWISSVTMEALIATHPDIAAVAYIGIVDDRWGERPTVFVVPREGAVVDIETLRAYLAEHVESGVISRYALPDRCVVLDRLPTTSVGKIDKKALRVQLEQEHSQRNHLSTIENMRRD